MHKTLVALMLVVSSALAWAEPSLQQVESEVRLGHLTQAETMMGEVVSAKPDSPKAHYIYAEVLARNQKFDQAVAEATKARTLDPAIKFTQPQKFKDFEQLLTRQQAATRMRGVPAPSTTPSTTAATGGSQFSAPVAVTAPALAPAAMSGGIPGWVWIVVLAVVGWFLWRGFAKSRATGAAAASPGAVGYGGGAGYPANQPGGPMNPNGPYGNQPYGAGMAGAAPGGGMLRTGLAVAGGVAGGMLIDQMLNHRGGNAAGFGSGGNNDLGLGPTMAPAGNDAATELETRQVDFGNGNDWGGGGSDAVDMGGSDDGGGGGGWD